MKKVFYLALLIFSGLASCKKDATPSVALNETVDTAVVSANGKGVFMNGPFGAVSGEAKVFSENGKFILQLQNMNISNGPDLHVYLSKEIQPVNFIDLGKLKSTIGNQLYDIPGNPDFEQYRNALIHCQQYNHLFGSAVLQ